MSWRASPSRGAREARSAATPETGAAPSPLNRLLGPGLVSGAADDDPSGIATYSQAGAALGYQAAWMLPLCYPLMAASQEISARIGRAAGVGLVGAITRHTPRPLGLVIAVGVAVANIANLGADLAAMADAVHLLIGGPQLVYAPAFAVLCAGLLLRLRYRRYVRAVKWAALALIVYLIVPACLAIPWAAVLRASLLPSLPATGAAVGILVAVLGTSISPYLLVWQSSLEADRARLLPAPAAWAAEGRRIRLDSWAGMAVAALVGYAVVLTCAATLHPAGIVSIVSSADAAGALRPVAGDLAGLAFALGIIGTGLLAVPMLAGSAAFALAEARGWPAGLAHAPSEAPGFYAAIVIATAIGAALVALGVNPIRALLLSAVLNGVVSVPVLVVMMRIASRKAVMGALALTPGLAALGWLTTLVMAAGGAALVVSLFEYA